METLKRWLRTAKVSQAEFARRCGISETQISKYCTGKLHSISMRNAFRIQEATSGGVPISAWAPSTVSVVATRKKGKAA